MLDDWKQRALSAEQRLDELNERTEAAWYNGYVEGRKFERRNRERLQELENTAPERQDRLYTAIHRARQEVNNKLLGGGR